MSARVVIPDHYIAIQEVHSRFFPKVVEISAILFLSKSIYSIVKDRYKLVNLMLDVFTYNEDVAEHTDPGVTLARLTFANTVSLLKHYYSIFRHVPILQLPQKVTMQKLKWLEQRLIELELSAKVLATHTEQPDLGDSLVATIKEYRREYARALRSRKAPDMREEASSELAPSSISSDWGYNHSGDDDLSLDSYIDMDIDSQMSVSPPRSKQLLNNRPLSPPTTPHHAPTAVHPVTNVLVKYMNVTAASFTPVTNPVPRTPAAAVPVPKALPSPSRSPSPPSPSRSPSPPSIEPAKQEIPMITFGDEPNLDGVQNEFGVFKDSCREKLRLFKFTVLEGKHMNKCCTLIHFNGSNAKVLDTATGDSFYLSNKTRICLHEEAGAKADPRPVKQNTLAHFRDTLKDQFKNCEFTIVGGKHDGKRCALLHFNGQNAKVIDIASGDSFYVTNTNEAKLHLPHTK